jgi:hypothetical protein
VNRSLLVLRAGHRAAAILLGCIACGGKVDVGTAASAAAMDEGRTQKDDAGVQREAPQQEASAPLYDAVAPPASEPAIIDAPGSAPCPPSVDAFCAQPNFVCSRTWASATESNGLCMQGADKVIFTSTAPCKGYEIASTLLWDNVQTVFIYEAVSGALVGITTRTGTESQGGIRTLCAIGPQWPSGCDSTPEAACMLH